MYQLDKTKTIIKEVSCRPDSFSELAKYLDEGWNIIGNNSYVFFIKTVVNNN